MRSHQGKQFDIQMNLPYENVLFSVLQSRVSDTVRIRQVAQHTWCNRQQLSHALCKRSKSDSLERGFRTAKRVADPIQLSYNISANTQKAGLTETEISNASEDKLRLTINLVGIQIFRRRRPAKPQPSRGCSVSNSEICKTWAGRLHWRHAIVELRHKSK